MEIPGNPWQEAWENSKPVPARRQKRLFDDTKEAENVLHYLTSLKPGELTQMVMPVLLHASVHRIIQESLSQVTHTNQVLNEAIPLLSQMSKLSCRPEVKHYSTADGSQDFNKRRDVSIEVIRRIQSCELKLAQALSLRSKFLKDALKVRATLFPTEDQDDVSKHMEHFVQDLYAKKEVKVVGASRGPAGQLIRQMFQEAHRAKEMLVRDVDSHLVEDEVVFPPEFSKEYIIRLSCPSPYPYSGKSPQRMYCCIKDNEFRLAGAFSVDKLYS